MNEEDLHLARAMVAEAKISSPVENNRPLKKMVTINADTIVGDKKKNFR